MSDDKLLLTVREVAELTGFAEGTLRHWVSSKKIPIVRFSSRCVRFRLTDIERWIAEQVVVGQKQDALLQRVRTDKAKRTKTLDKTASGKTEANPGCKSVSD